MTIIYCINFPICVILDCFPFWGGGSVVVDLLFYEPPTVCGGPLFGLCFGMHYFESVRVCNHVDEEEKRAGCFVLLSNPDRDAYTPF